MKMFLLCAFSLTAAFAAEPAAPRLAPAKVSAEIRSLNGAWRLKDDPSRIMLVMDGYFSDTSFDLTLKIFSRTYGGMFAYAGGISTGRFDFDSGDTPRAGKTFSVPVKLQGSELVVGTDNENETWTRLDSGSGDLAGVWRMTGRETNGTLGAIPPGPQKTLKIVTGSRFQWIAMNTETGEFNGTGGGTYTFQDGKYTEQLEFFSRDDTRAGLTLPFEAEVRGAGWHQRGKNSQGEPLHEVWTRL